MFALLRSLDSEDRGQIPLAEILGGVERPILLHRSLLEQHAAKLTFRLLPSADDAVALARHKEPTRLERVHEISAARERFVAHQHFAAHGDTRVRECPIGGAIRGRLSRRRLFRIHHGSSRMNSTVISLEISSYREGTGSTRAPCGPLAKDNRYCRSSRSS